METHVTQLTHFVNHYLGQFAVAILNFLHIKPSNPATPIPESTVMALLVLVVVTVLALFLRSRLSVERPGATQQIAEILLTNPMGFGIRDLLEENVPHGAEKYVPFVGSISIFILFSNLLGLFPRLAAPTGIVSVPLGCAVLTFVYFNLKGFQHHGFFGYLATFAGAPKKLGDWAL